MIYVTMNGRHREKSGVAPPVQESAGRSESVNERFLVPGELVLNLFSGTFVTAEPSAKLPRHCIPVVCNVYANCFIARTEELAEKISKLDLE